MEDSDPKASLFLGFLLTSAQLSPLAQPFFATAHTPPSTPMTKPPSLRVVLLLAKSHLVSHYVFICRHVSPLLRLHDVFVFPHILCHLFLHYSFTGRLVSRLD